MLNKQISKCQIDIHERIYKFILRVLKLLASLPKTPLNLIIVDQCGRPITSVGANDQEADACESRRDFIAKFSLVKKELKETNYWLRLIFDTNQNLQKQMKDLQEGKEILLIVSSIIKNAKRGRKFEIGN
ncbi:MAG: four helix bundle protein [Patescibacteria group bacterium]